MKALRFAIILYVTFSMLACQNDAPQREASNQEDIVLLAERLEQAIPTLLEEHKVAGAGVAVIRDGDIAWSGYFGQQSPKTGISPATVFNTASVAKTVAAETLIALAAKDLISLDEPIHHYVQHEDLGTDERYKLLTVRMLLSHRGGLKNWPYEYDNFTPTFIFDPGTDFSYSGMGFDLAAQYAENKLATDFEVLAEQHVLAPLHIKDLSLGRIKPWMTDRLSMPMDNEGQFFDMASGYSRFSPKYNDGGWSAADDLLVTVQSYARFMTNAITADWPGDDWHQARLHIESTLEDNEIWHCDEQANYDCPLAYGHSLGWMIYRYKDRTLLKHGGNDAGENALVVYDPDARRGSVIFVNGGNGIHVSTQILGLIGDTPDLAAYYRALIRNFYGIALPDPRE